MLHVESDWLWYLISGIFGTEILIQAEGLVEVISSGVPPSWADGASVAMVSANVCMAGLAVLTLTLLWRRSQWTRVAIWTWSVPVALVSTWLLVTEIAAFEFESWMFYIGGRGLTATRLGVLTGLYAHTKQVDREIISRHIFP
jgi:hypothetical protein